MVNQCMYTIGHSNHTIMHFIELLKKHGITAVADVRSHPYSRIYPQYSQKALKAALQEEGVYYDFFGKELGGRSDNPAIYRHGKVQFDLLEKEPAFIQGIERLQCGIKIHRIAVMCAEKDPLYCHRSILVARRIHESGVVVNHLLADGGFESHAQLEARMLRSLKMENEDLFRKHDDLLHGAYQQHGEKIAFSKDRLRRMQS